MMIALAIALVFAIGIALWSIISVIIATYPIPANDEDDDMGALDG